MDEDKERFPFDEIHIFGHWIPKVCREKYRKQQEEEAAKKQQGAASDEQTKGGEP